MGEKAFIMVGPQGSLHGARGPAQGDRGLGLLSGARQRQAQAGLQGQGPVHLPGRLQAVPLGNGPPGMGQHVCPVL